MDSGKWTTDMNGERLFIMWPNLGKRTGQLMQGKTRYSAACSVRLVTRNTLQSRKWQVIANNTAAHYTTIHRLCQQIIEPTEQPADIPPLQSAFTQKP